MRANPPQSREYIYINGARHVEISDGLFIDTLTLHRIVAWSKRGERPSGLYHVS